MITTEYLREKYLRIEVFPTLFCEGCGCGMVMNALCRAMEESGIPHENFVYVSGIGCSSWIPNPYMRVDSMHTVHGRAIPAAIGIKLANPKLTVVVVTGDGDGASIGGNHLIHAARMNADIKVILVNNFTYGMTGGQASPTTPLRTWTPTTPYGNSQAPFDLTELVIAAGATFVARWATAHMVELVRSLVKAFRRRGFSFVEVLSQCPVYYGRYVGIGRGAEMLKYFRNITSLEKVEGKIRVGEFVDIQRETLDELVR